MGGAIDYETFDKFLPYSCLCVLYLCRACGWRADAGDCVVVEGALVVGVPW